jgi:long-chain fatty acid transport protein
MLKRFLFVVVIMSIVSMGFAGGIALSGVGTRAKAMGGAMRGLADDASAMYWNPAGLSFLEETTLTAGIHYVDFNGEYEMQDGDTFENEDVLNLIPSLIYAKNCPDKAWNWGLGIYIPFGLSAEWDIYEQQETFMTYPLGWSEMIEENEVFGSLMVIDFHPTFSYKFSDQLSAGLGLSLDYASIELTKVELMDENGLVPMFFQMEGTGMTYGANFGVMYKPTECLSIGLSGRTESEINFDGSANIDLHYNEFVASQDPNIPSAMVINSNPDAEATLTLPADFGAGLGYKINENWLVSADFTYTMWESIDVINIEFEEGAMLGPIPLIEKEMILNWENTIRFGLGTEYLMNEWAFRSGYYYDESPLVDETMGVTFPDFNTKHAINLGCGYMINDNLCLDFAVEYIMFEEREVDEYVNEDEGYENWPGTYNGGIIDIMIDLTWKF